MADRVVNLFVIMAVGVILADMVMNWQGTAALFCGVANLWNIGVNGMLGKQATPMNCGGGAPAAGPPRTTGPTVPA